MTRYTGNPQTKENCRKSCIIHALANFTLSVPNNNLAVTDEALKVQSYRLKFFCRLTLRCCSIN